MIYCLSCEKYPRDIKVIPYGSNFPIDTFKVRLLSDTTPTPLPKTGADVENLADTAKFAVGSLLFVRNGSSNKATTYVFVDGEFKLWTEANGGGGGGSSIGGLIIEDDGSAYIG